jgi:hypothetical protein
MQRCGDAQQGRADEPERGETNWGHGVRSISSIHVAGGILSTGVSLFGMRGCVHRRCTIGGNVVCTLSGSVAGNAVVPSDDHRVSVAPSASDTG